MPVMTTKTPNSTAIGGSGGKSTKVPFKKVFSSSHLLSSNGHRPAPRPSCGAVDVSALQQQLSGQLSSSLPGILDKVNQSKHKQPTKQASNSLLNKSSQPGGGSDSTNSAVISGIVMDNGIPFSAIEPSLIVSLANYLASLKNFDSRKLIKEIELMLKYFEDAVKKNKLELLSGSSTILLETVDKNCALLKNAYLQLQQVQLQLQLLSNINLDDTPETRVQPIQSSPVIEATNDLYRSLSELLQWSDRVCNLAQLPQVVVDDGQKSEATTSATPDNTDVSVVSAKLLQSFENLAKAYKGMESELRHCYEDYLNTNNKNAELILAESNAAAANAQAMALRRRSVTPPPDYNRLTNCSLSTISSSSSCSSNSSNFLSKHRFLPNVITNHAQKMAHQFDFKKLRLKGGKEKASAGEPPDKHSFFFLPFMGSNSNLKRSESASDLASAVKSSYLTQPEPTQSTLARVFRKRSINDTKLQEVFNLVKNKNTSQVKRFSDELDNNGGQKIATKEMIFNPLYFTPRFESHHSYSSDSLLTKSTPPQQQPKASSSTSSPKCRKTESRKYSTVEDDSDRPPPLPPKTYHARSASSARSSIASNTSSLLKDSDSGLGTMPSTSCDLQKEIPNQLNNPNTRHRAQSQDLGTVKPKELTEVEYSQVTLRPKKARANLCHQCRQPIDGRNRPASPPPLPSPESFIFGTNQSVDKSCEKNKENFALTHHHAHHHHHHHHHQHQPECQCTCARRQVRTYRRAKAQSMSITKAYRSFSIDDTSSSTLKLADTSSGSSSHSFQHRSLAHSLSICDTGGSLIPPPLPPKRRNMHAYMVVVGNYSGPSDQSEMYYYSSRVNYSKSMIDPPLHRGGSVRQGSASSSIMSLSSSASSSSSLSTGGSPSNLFTAAPATTTTADPNERYQYQHLPIAPPPPPEVGSSTPPPPLLPPRRDKTIDVASIPPPIPPPPANRQQQIGAGSPTNPPRSSTPVKSPEAPLQCTCHLASPVEAEKAVINSSLDEADEEIRAEDTPVDELDDSAGSIFCTICSEETIHEEEDCILSQLDVPQETISYKQPDDEDDSFDDLNIRGGTIDALLIKASQASTSGADATFLDAFLTTHRAFVTPHQLITKLIFRYNQFTANREYRTDIVRQAVARKVVEFIILLFNETYLYDFDKSLSQALMEFIYQLVGRGELAHAKCLREKCYEKLRQRDREFVGLGKNAITIPPPPPPPAQHNMSTRTLTLLDFKSEHLAEQMTLLDSRLFHKIETPEILIWAKEQKEELIPNLSTFTEHFNKMSFWTRSQILRCEEHKERERYVLKFLKIMKHLRKLNNFNSYLAILSALCSAPISRLDWPKNTTETLKEYNALIDSSSSFRTYRTALALAKPPCIPYIGLILQDLTFVHVGNSDFLPDGKINFSKHLKQYNILKQMKQFKQCKYSINENEQIISLFDNFNDYLQEEVMWQISESIKPRGGSNAANNSVVN